MATVGANHLLKILVVAGWRIICVRGFVAALDVVSWGWFEGGSVIMTPKCNVVMVVCFV